MCQAARIARTKIVSKTDLVFQTRPENLAFAFQEILTAIMRLRTNSQSVSDANVFRTQAKKALNLADKEARKLGYAAETVRLAVFAVVALLDESVLNQQAAKFTDWARKPLQEELFGVHVAGEIFFENLRKLLQDTDSTEIADVLELHELCLLLGYRGRYGVGAKGELRALIEEVDDKVRRIRGDATALSPAWSIPQQEVIRLRPDPWARRLVFVFLSCLGIMLLLFVGFRVSLESGISALEEIVSQAKK